MSSKESDRLNNITITGIISRINNEHYNNQIWFDICNNEKYKDKDGLEVSRPSFFNARISESRADENLLKVGNLVTISGIPKSYKDKNGNDRFYIFVLGLSNKKNEDKMISYDTDGVMLWHGKRCESQEATPEEVKEMEDLLSEFK